MQIDLPTVHERNEPLNEVLNETEVHEGKKYLKCHFDNCDYTAVPTWKSCKTMMLKHIRAVHGGEKEDLPTVHERNELLNEVLNEAEVHEGKKYLKCHFDDCDYTAVQTWKSCKTMMLQHIRTVHGGEKEDLTCHYINCDYSSKGHLISKYPFGVFKWTKKPMNLLS